MKTFIPVILALVLSSCTPSMTLTLRNPLPRTTTNITVTAPVTPKNLYPYYAWKGTTISSDGTRDLDFDYQVYSGNSISGEYTISRIWKGQVEGTLIDGILTGQAIKDSECIWEISGQIQGDKFEVQGTPTYCPKGSSFTWILRPA